MRETDQGSVPTLGEKEREKEGETKKTEEKKIQGREKSKKERTEEERKKRRVEGRHSHIGEDTAIVTSSAGAEWSQSPSEGNHVAMPAPASKQKYLQSQEP